MSLAARTYGEAVAFLEETGECTGKTPRGMGPSTYIRNAEIMSGRSLFQQGLAATCKDHEEERKQSRVEDLGLAHEPV